MSNLDPLITCLLSKLQKLQKPDGSFENFSSPQPCSMDFSDLVPKKYTTNFNCALILSCLSGTEHPIQAKLKAFLLSTKSNTWTWNYWAKSSAEFSLIPYPDDLDDTFSVLASLISTNYELSPEAMASIVKILIANEIQEGGPYKTWIGWNKLPQVWHDVDIVVNANIHHFLALSGIHLNPLTNYIDQCISNDALESRYYPTLYHSIYFISRSYKGPNHQKLFDSLKDCPRTPLMLSIKLSSILHLIGNNDIQEYTGAMQETYQGLVSMLEPIFDGSAGLLVTIQPEAICIDPAIDKIAHHNCSESATLAFCIEALILYKNFLGKTKAVQSSHDLIHEEVMEEAKKILVGHEVAIDSIIHKLSIPEITLLPQYFIDAFPALRQNLKECGIDTDAYCRRLGAINLLGWAVYDIYDDILDESTHISLLPTANILHKHVLLDIVPLIETCDISTRKMLQKMLYDMDRAMINEALRQTVPVISDGYKKSIGHALGPLLLLGLSTLSSKTELTEHTYNFFKYYLITRQLNDDAHDWLEDLRSGIITPVTTILREFWNQNHEELSPENVEINIEKLRTVFWNDIFENIAAKILYHANLAKESLSNLPLTKNTQFISMIQRLENSVHNARKQSADIGLFIKTYSRSSV